MYWRPGSLVQIHGIPVTEAKTEGEDPVPLADLNGELSLVVNYIPADGKYHVRSLNGVSARVGPEHVRTPANLQKHCEGSPKESFDLVLGPAMTEEFLGNEIALCLREKGFCVLRIAQGKRAQEQTLDKLRDMGDDGKLNRLPEELEEGQLGVGCQGKVVWMSQNDADLNEEEILTSSDEMLTYIARSLQPHSADTLGELIGERTPSLVCVSLTADEEPEYPFPIADDKLLGEFLDTWRRSLVRGVCFVGPDSPQVGLVLREGPNVPWLPKLAEHVVVEAFPNTVLLFRPECYEYICKTPIETLMLVTNFLSPSTPLVVDRIDPSALDEMSIELATGPPPPPGDEHIDVLNIVSRCSGRLDDGASLDVAFACGCDSVVMHPKQRWDIEPYWTADVDHAEVWQAVGKHMGFCEGVEFFDNRYFEISNAEAVTMDPVQRQILETGSQSLAMYGITKKDSNRKAIHAGFSVGNDKLDWMMMDHGKEAMTGTATVLAIIANRFSFVFNMKGPNFVCDTACSASLVSSHLAKLCMYERTWDPLEFHISMGAHLCLNGTLFLGGGGAHMHTVLGRCFTFNSSADGYLRGEGTCGMMFKFGRDENRLAIFRASQIGQDGRSASLTAPNGPAQEECIHRCIREARMTPPESTVWECHGTGTALGDPIEVGAVRKIQIKMPRVEPLLLGSVKSNYGHMEGAAGMGGMVKCVCQVGHARCVPTLQVRTLNPHLQHTQFEASFSTELGHYNFPQGHSQISSFGFGGTNGHAIFWGTDLTAKMSTVDLATLFRKKLESLPPPEVRAKGPNPDDWEWDAPDTRNTREDTKWSVTWGSADSLEGEPVGPQSAKWSIEDEGAPEVDYNTFWFTITGNFNDWAADERMLEGHVLGLSTTTVRVPSSGYLEFRFLRSGDPESVVCPASPNCTQKTEEILGPAEGLLNTWVVQGAPESEIRIELFFNSKARSILWFRL